MLNICFTGPRYITSTDKYNLINYLNFNLNCFKAFKDVNYHVGDADGVDFIIHSFLKYNHLNVTKHVVINKKEKSSYAKRSMDMVNECISETNAKGIIFGFPNKECPLMVTPNNPFCGSGSGTWATLAYAKSKSILIYIKSFKSVPRPDWL